MTSKPPLHRLAVLGDRWRAIFALALGLTIFALKQAIDAVTAMNGLIWQSTYFEKELKDKCDSNVTNLKVKR